MQAPLTTCPAAVTLARSRAAAASARVTRTSAAGACPSHMASDLDSPSRSHWMGHLACAAWAEAERSACADHLEPWYALVLSYVKSSSSDYMRTHACSRETPASRVGT